MGSPLPSHCCGATSSSVDRCRASQRGLLGPPQRGGVWAEPAPERWQQRSSMPIARGTLGGCRSPSQLRLPPWYPSVAWSGSGARRYAACLRQQDGKSYSLTALSLTASYILQPTADWSLRGPQREVSARCGMEIPKNAAGSDLVTEPTRHPVGRHGEEEQAGHARPGGCRDGCGGWRSTRRRESARGR